MRQVIIVAALAIIITLGAVSISRHRDRPTTTRQEVAKPTTAIRYLPLGDSYTIGQSVDENERWPNQLVTRLASAGKHVEIIDNPAVTGYTTQDLIDQELPLLERLKPDFVSIQIGVNDYVQGGDEATFKEHLQYIINSVRQQLAKPENIILVTIPDYGLTPTGARYGDPQQSHNAILAYNKIIQQAAADHSLAVADVFPASQQVSKDPSLIADDGLHPSGKQYSLWTDAIVQAMQVKGLPQ